jgi:hypothetical protein
MRSPPLNNTRGPEARRPLTIIVVSALVLTAVGLGAHQWNTTRRTANVQRAVAEAGYGRADVVQMRGDECWRAREGFRWRTETAEGWACAGPGREVAVHVGRPNGRWP